MTPVVEYFRYPYTFKLRSMVGDFQVLAIGFIIIVTSMTWRVMHAHGELSNGTFQPGALTEVALARSILYPFIFPWYNNLTDNLTIAISLLFICLCLLMFSLTYSRDVRILIISCFLSFAIFWILTLVMRQNITEYFNEYRSTWPDRYFMGLNYITLFIFTLLAGNLTRYIGFRRLIGVAGLVAVTSIFITKCFWLFEFREPRMNLAAGISFREQICLSGLLTNGHAQEYVIVSIHAYGWQMSVPEKIFQDAVSRSDCSAVLQSFFLTDTNWTRGVANIWAGFLMPNTLEYKNALQEGVKLRFANGEVREIVRQEEAGNFLHIFVDGEPLDGKVIGYPYEFEIMP